MFVLDALIAIHIPRVDWIKVKEVEGSLLGDKAQRWVQGGGGGGGVQSWEDTMYLSLCKKSKTLIVIESTDSKKNWMCEQA